MKDYYYILELNKDATNDQIKKQYRKLAIQHHPDKGGDSEKFKAVAEAYSVLSDPGKKAQYDNPMPQFNIYENSQFIDPNELFKQFFGNMNLNAAPNTFFAFPANMFNMQQTEITLPTNLNCFSRSTKTQIRGNKMLEKTTEIKNGVKTEFLKETNMQTGEVKIYNKKLK